MFFQDPEKEIIFKHKCTIAEESNSRRKLQEIDSRLEVINDNLEILNKKYIKEKDTEIKNQLEEQVILNIAEIRSLTSYKKFLTSKLKLIRPIGDSKPTLAYSAKKAKEALIEMRIF